jgi:hypothetical protein
MTGQEFVKVQGTQLFRDGKPYRVVGTNFWHGMNMGAIEGKMAIFNYLDHDIHGYIYENRMGWRPQAP